MIRDDDILALSEKVEKLEAVVIETVDQNCALVYAVCFLRARLHASGVLDIHELADMAIEHMNKTMGQDESTAELLRALLSNGVLPTPEIPKFTLIRGGRVDPTSHDDE